MVRVNEGGGAIDMEVWELPAEHFGSFVDGIPATMPDGQGAVSHVAMAGAERIEVMRGPFSALYGNSSGGVIQVHSAEGDGRPPSGHAMVAASRDDARTASASLRGGTDRVGYALAGKLSREAAAAAHGFGKGQGYTDPFNLFGTGARPQHKAEADTGRKLGKLERNALADLDLDEDADGPTIRARYIELVKRTHPDSNGGDRSAEHKLQRVIKAYQLLKKSKLA